MNRPTKTQQGSSQPTRGVAGAAPSSASLPGSSDPLSASSTLLPPSSADPLSDLGTRASPPAGDAASGHADPLSSEPTRAPVPAGGTTKAAAQTPAAAAGTGEGNTGREQPTVGSYVILERLGSGGMGVVYRAVHKHHRHKEYALKLIRPEIDSGPAYERYKEQFVREGTILQEIQHPNVLRCYTTEETVLGGRPALYMVLELLEGQAVNAALSQGALPLERCLEIMLGVTRALCVLHQNKILHRDIKPANLWLNKCGHVKLLDFGLANIADWRIDFVSQASWGSPPYMPPEQFAGLKNCTAASDLYSLGCTLYEMMTGLKPFRPTDGSEYERLHRLLAPAPPEEAFPGIERGLLLDNLWHVSSKLLAKDPGERYGSAEALLTDLERARAGEHVETYRVTPGWVLELKRRLRVAAVALTIVAVLATAVFFGTRRFLVSRTPAIVEQARRLYAERQFEAVLAAADGLPDDLGEEHRKTVVDLKAQSVAALRERTPILEGFAQAEKAGAEGRLEEAAKLASEALANAKASDRFSAEELTQRSRRTADLATARDDLELSHALAAREAGHHRDARDRLARLLARPDLPAPTRTRATAELRATISSEQQATLDRALAAAQRNDLGAAQAELSTLSPESTLATLASRREVVQRIVEGEKANAEGELLRLSGKHPQALEAVRGALNALRVLSPQEEGLAAAVEGTLLRLTAREALIDAGARVASADSALDWTAALEAAARARELAPSSDEAARSAADRLVVTARAGLEGASEEVRRERYVRAMNEARAELFAEDGKSIRREARGRIRKIPGVPERVEALCREALHNLPSSEASRFRNLAAAFEAARVSAVGPAREALVAGLQELRRADEAWRLLELAVALREMADGECLVPRLGEVNLGDDQAQNRNPPHTVTLPPFYIDRRETDAVSFIAYLAGAGPAVDRAPFDEAWAKRPIPSAIAGEPIRLVTVAEAQAYARSLSPPKRLPTPDEWEVAASVPDASSLRLAYPWGSQWEAGRQPSVSALPSATGGNPPDVSPWGCEDMGGNVSEWTLTESGTVVLKGGSFGVTDTPSAFLVVRRMMPSGDRRSDWWGFRCARDVPAPGLAEFLSTDGGGR